METHTTTTRAALSCRISEDPTGQRIGTKRQLDDAQELARERGWDVIAEFTDNDISALTGVHRPGYTALMDAVDAGEVDQIVCYKTSRLWRNRRQRAEAMELLRERGVTVTPVRGQALDFSTAAGRMIVGVLGEFDTAESEYKSERTKDAAKHRRAQGRSNGPVMFGWKRTYVTNAAGRVVDRSDEVDPDQAAIVNEIVDRLLAGDTINAIARDLTERGIPACHHSYEGRPKDRFHDGWNPTSVRKLAYRPANISILMRERKAVGKACWPPIVDQDKHDAVCVLLANPARRSNWTAATRKHLLTFGIGECGVCGWRLRVAPKSGNDLYLCDSDRSCVGRREVWVNEYVEAVVVARLSRPDAVELLTPEPKRADVSKLLARAEALRSRLDDAADSYANGSIDARQLERITAKLWPEMDAVEREASWTPRQAALSKEARGVIGTADAAKRWAQLSISAKRDVMTALGMRVIIMRTKQGPGLGPEDVRIMWDGLQAIA